MSGSIGLMGNIAGYRLTVAALDIANVPANSGSETTKAVPNLPAGLFGVGRPVAGALTAGLSVANIYTTAGVIHIQMANATAGAIDPAAADWEFVLFSPSGEAFAV